MSIERIDVGPRMSQIVIHGETIYLAGQVGTENAPIKEQCESALAGVDALLAKAGSDKSKILSTTIWLADMADFGAMNAAWEAWVPAGQTPARATGEAKLATPGYKVEFLVIAAK